MRRLLLHCWLWLRFAAGCPRVRRTPVVHPSGPTFADTFIEALCADVNASFGVTADALEAAAHLYHTAFIRRGNDSLIFAWARLKFVQPDAGGPRCRCSTCRAHNVLADRVGRFFAHPPDWFRPAPSLAPGNVAAGSVAAPHATCSAPPPVADGGE